MGTITATKMLFVHGSILLMLSVCDCLHMFVCLCYVVCMGLKGYFCFVCNVIAIEVNYSYRGNNNLLISNE